MGDNEFEKFKRTIETEEKIIVLNAFGKDIQKCYGKKQIMAIKKLYNKLILQLKKLIVDTSIAYNNVDGFEKLIKPLEYQKKYPTLDIFRYELREFSNLRCLFIMDSESGYVFLTGAFIEDWNKSKRK